MTLSVQQSRIVYVGPITAGSVVPIPFNYREALHVNASLGTELLVQGQDYTVLGQNVTVLIDIPEDSKLAIYRTTPLDNSANFPQEAEFDSEKMNDALDKLTMIVQEQEDSINRSAQMSIDTPEGTAVITLPTPNPGKGLKWDPTGSVLINSTYDLDSATATAIQQATVAVEKAAEATSAKNQAVASAASASTSATSASSSASSAQTYATQAQTAYINIDSRIENMLRGLTQAQWDDMSASERADIPLALIYE